MSDYMQAVDRLQATAIYEASQELGIPEAELSIACLNSDGKAVRAHLMLSGLSLCHVSAYDVLEASAGLYNLVHAENLPGYLRAEQAAKSLASIWLGLPKDAFTLSYLPGLTFTAPKWTVYLMTGDEPRAMARGESREQALLTLISGMPLPEGEMSIALLMSPALPEAVYQNEPTERELVARLQETASHLYEESSPEAIKVELKPLADGQWLARILYPFGDIQEATEGAKPTRVEALQALLKALEAVEEPEQAEAPYSEAEAGACLEATRLASLIWPEHKPFAVKVSSETEEGDSYYTASVDSTSEADCYLDGYTERSRLEALVSLVTMLRLRLPEEAYQTEQARQAEHEEAWAEIEQATEQAPHLVEAYQKWYQSWQWEPTPQERRLARALFNVSEAEAKQAEEAN